MIITFIIVYLTSRELGNLQRIFGAESLHLKCVTAYYFCSIIILLTLVPYRHMFPWSYIFHLLLTIGSSLCTSTAGIEYGHEIQMYSIYATISTAVVLTIYAFHTHIDYTIFGSILYYGLCLAFAGGMIALAQFDAYHPFVISHSFFGATLFAFFFLYDTQIMLGGTHFVRLDPARHNFVTSNIYVNMQMTFYYHLHLFSYYLRPGKTVIIQELRDPEIKA